MSSCKCNSIRHKRLNLHSFGLQSERADVNAKDGRAITALVKAAGRGSLPFVKMLLSEGIDANAEDCYGKTALTYAACGGHTKVVRLLIARGATVKTKENFIGLTALMCAINNVAYFGSTNSMHGYGSTKLISLLITKGANVNASDSLNNSVLHYAVIRNRVDVVEMLINEGANVNAKNITGYTPLITAAGYGFIKVIRSLLGADADVNAVTNRSHSALWMAIKKGKSRTAQLLREVGASEIEGIQANLT